MGSENVIFYYRTYRRRISYMREWRKITGYETCLKNYYFCIFLRITHGTKSVCVFKSLI